MDAKALQYGSGSFDAIIDKACFDAVLCGKDAKESSETFLNEIHRVLNANGVYVCVTFGHPESRLPYFSKKEFEWTVFTQKVPKPAISKDSVVAAKEADDNNNYHFVYIMRKRPQIKDWECVNRWTFRISNNSLGFDIAFQIAFTRKIIHSGIIFSVTNIQDIDFEIKQNSNSNLI